MAKHPCPQCDHRTDHCLLDVVGDDCDTESLIYLCGGCRTVFAVGPERQIAGVPVDDPLVTEVFPLPT